MFALSLRLMLTVFSWLKVLITGRVLPATNSRWLTRYLLGQPASCLQRLLGPKNCHTVFQSPRKMLNWPKAAAWGTDSLDLHWLKSHLPVSLHSRISRACWATYLVTCHFCVVSREGMCAEEPVRAGPFLDMHSFRDQWARNIPLGVIWALVEDAYPCPFRYSLLWAVQMLLQWHPLTSLEAAAMSSDSHSGYAPNLASFRKGDRTLPFLYLSIAGVLSFTNGANLLNIYYKARC